MSTSLGAQDLAWRKSFKALAWLNFDTLCGILGLRINTDRAPPTERPVTEGIHGMAGKGTLG